MQKILNESYGEDKCHVIDKGKPVTGSGYIVSILKETLDRCRPRYVVVMTGSNDFYLPDGMRYDAEDVFKRLKICRWYFFLMR